MRPGGRGITRTNELTRGARRAGSASPSDRFSAAPKWSGGQRIVLEFGAGCVSDGAEAPERQRLRGRLEWLPDVDSNHEPTG
jgi:hypothetical protein